MNELAEWTKARIGENPLYLVKLRLFDLGISETTNMTVWADGMSRRGLEAQS